METAKFIVRKYVDSANIEYLLFFNEAKNPVIRVRDLDAEENIALTIYERISQATADYYSLVAKVQHLEAKIF